MDLLKESELLGKRIKHREKEKTDEQNKYKQMCTKFGIRPAKSIEELSDPIYLEDNASVLRNIQPAPGGASSRADEQTLLSLRRERESRREHIEMMKHDL